ncbi:hypothetical protein K1T73_15600 [Roseovarius sp. SCSIO 43702]|uniref:calcium-binding protein n=1 Tax=Roseovarius sp. SCSIO 43702 TaxID=2823043 RepID=UPI001C72F327|nr:calcium-binding protein [Roseovarius sp. SCSIO 43702]QYX56457.1 hypothetical protein K1T73_15600 [Roseovarius sp. SCSIO 43702]
MIDIKSIRSGDSATSDPTDPLSLRELERDGTKFFSGWAVGLLGLGLYLKSFLWAEPRTVLTAAEEEPAPTGEDEAPSPPKTGSLTPSRTKSEPHEFDQAADEAPEAEGSDAPAWLPVVLGRFQSIFVDPVSFTAHGAEGAANAFMPPFTTFDGLYEDPARPSFSAAGGASAVQGSGGSDDMEAVSDEEEDTDDETAEEERDRMPRNTGPVQLGDVGSGAVLAMSMAYFLSRTEHMASDEPAITIDTLTSGELEQRGEGWRYVADTDFLGEVLIEYTITDGAISLVQSAILTVVENLFDGTEFADLLVGTRGRDAIYGHEGDDNLAGLGGRDRIFGGEGDDNITGGDGNDSLSGGNGDDMIAGGDGDDWISGGAGHDRLYGEAGDDVIHGDAGNDTVEGGTGNDVVFGGEGDDLLEGNEGDDIVSGEAGDDMLSGGAGNDVLTGGEGSDRVEGGAGDDVVVADDDHESDHFDGGEGEDRLDYSGASEAVDIDLITQMVSGDSVGEDSFENFEHLVGSTGDDRFLAGSGEGTLTGNGGEDLFNFVQGDTVDVIHSIFRITDFDFDDRISFGSGSSHRELRKAQESFEERIEDDLENYAENIGANEPRLEYRYDWTDTYRRTVIEVDFDRDTTIDLEVFVDGEHVFVIEQA